ncbi:MAG: catechol 2,3-dioxygenase [Acidimicrobiia bacterium]
MAVMRLGYTHIRVTDLAEAKKHYSRTIGMNVVAESANQVHLKCWDEYDHHSLVIEEGGVGLVKLGYKVEKADDLAAFESRAQQFGAIVERMGSGDNLAVGDGVRIVLPSDHVIELYAEMEFTGTDTGCLNPDPYPRDTSGIGVPRIDHALITAEDVETVERFFQEVLDFQVTERVITEPVDPMLIGTWLSCSNTPHDIAFVKGPNGKFHHFAYLLEDWNAILKAGDLFAMDDVPVDVGPTRHGITRGTTIYFFDPSGNRNEVFAGGYTVFKDFPCITWTADQIGKGIFYIQRELNERFTTVVT